MPEMRSNHHPCNSFYAVIFFKSLSQRQHDGIACEARRVGSEPRFSGHWIVQTELYA